MTPEDVERFFMQPLDTDIDYGVVSRPDNPGSRFNVLLILPIIGFLLILVFISAAIFQFDLSDLVDSLVGFLLLLFFVMIAGLFWAMAPRAQNQ